MPRFLRFALIGALALSLTLVTANERAQVADATPCAPRIGPGIPPPANVPSGIPGLHAYWYGQSGYPTLCAGDTASAVVAYYNAGSVGWGLWPAEGAVSLGTSGPQQDQASILGGNATHASIQTRWSEYNRPAVQPASWVGPGQVAWFQFTVKAPATPGTYRLYLRPLIEGQQWLEDFGVYWDVTVLATTTTRQRVSIQSVDRAADVFVADGATYHYDSNDGFELGDGTLSFDEFERTLAPGVVIDVRYESTAAERSAFNIYDAPFYGKPIVSATLGNFDRGAANDDVALGLAAPASGEPQYGYNIQRASVAAATTSCGPTSGNYDYGWQFWQAVRPDTYFDGDVGPGTYCYRATPTGGVGNFAYTAPVRIPATP